MFYTKIFLVVLIVDSFSEALLSTSPAWTVPANVQITATQLFFHYRLCKTNYYYHYYQARARSPRARRACALRALGLLLADGTPTVGGGKTF